MTALLFLALAAANPAPADLSVVGTIVGRDPAHSVAILSSGGRVRSAGPGEAIFGGRVLAVGPGTVSIAYGDERVELRLATIAPAAPPSPPPPAPEARSPEDPAPPARSMERRELERRLGEEVPRILAETVVVPVTEDGRVAGLAITRMPEGSLLTDAGLRPGDVLTSINGTPIVGLATLIGLYPRLQTERELHAVVLRNGRPVSLTVTLR